MTSLSGPQHTKKRRLCYLFTPASTLHVDRLVNETSVPYIRYVQWAMCVRSPIQCVRAHWRGNITKDTLLIFFPKRKHEPRDTGVQRGATSRGGSIAFSPRPLLPAEELRHSRSSVLAFLDVGIFQLDICTKRKGDSFFSECARTEISSYYSFGSTLLPLPNGTNFNLWPKINNQNRMRRL